MFEPSACSFGKDAAYQLLSVERGGESYQIMRGTFQWGNGTDPMGAAKLTVKFVYRVLAMKNGDEIQPEFTFWFAGNGVPGENTAVGSFSGANYQIVCQNPASCANHNNIEPYHISGRKTTVSCYPFMNLKLMGGNSTLDKVLQKWDFSSGSADAQSRVTVNGSTYNETVTGRSTSFAAAVILCSPTGNGLRGVELPDTGNITFDLQLSSVFLNNNNQNITTTGYSPLLWSVEGNAANKAVGSAHVHNGDGRWVPSGLTYVNYNAPYNKRSTLPGYDSCYDGGTWTATQEITSGGSVLHVTVSDYVFNKEHLPYRGSTNSGNVYYDPAIVEDRYWEVDNAVFSVGEFWLVQPTYNINDPSVSIVSDENTDSAQIRTTARVKNGAINAPVGETVVTAQTLTTDDTYNVSLEVRDKAGSIGSYIFYVKSSDYTVLSTGCSNNGRDWTFPGNDLCIYSYITQSGQERSYRSIADDLLIKFDDEFLDATGSKMRYSYKDSSYEILYAAKPDGSGWSSDQEMKDTTADGLVYYSDLQTLKDSGKTCVGLFTQMRGLVAENTASYTSLILNATAKSTAAPGTVYMTVHNARTWDLASVEDSMLAYYNQSLEEDERYTSVNELTKDQINTWVSANFPRLWSDKTQPLAAASINYNDYPAPTYAKYHGGKTLSAEYENYIKTVYDGSGLVVEETASNTIGDSCLVVKELAEIGISVIKYNGAAGTSSAYHIDHSERIADLQIDPKINYPALTGGVGEIGEQTADIIITVDLPKKLFYRSGSSYWGGKYTPQATYGRTEGTVENVINFDEEKTFLDEDTEHQYYYLAVSEDGRTLTYLLKNYVIDWSDEQNAGGTATLPSPHFSADIGENGSPDDVTDGENLKITAKIRTADDHREYKAAYNNISSCSVLITIPLIRSRLRERNISFPTLHPITGGPSFNTIPTDRSIFPV